MNIQIKKTNPVQKKEYPKLMISKAGLIVMFTAKGTGTALGSEDDTAYEEPGEHSDCWAMESFTDFTGSITLSNK